MSFNRENVIWQNKDGTWGRGFFDFVVKGPNRERDVEYRFDAFKWATTGQPSEEAAWDSWRGANPGGNTRVVYSKKNKAEIEKYERMAVEFLAKHRPLDPSTGELVRRLPYQEPFEPVFKKRKRTS